MIRLKNLTKERQVSFLDPPMQFNKFEPTEPSVPVLDLLPDLLGRAVQTDLGENRIRGPVSDFIPLQANRRNDPHPRALLVTAVRTFCLISAVLAAYQAIRAASAMPSDDAASNCLA